MPGKWVNTTDPATINLWETTVSVETRLRSPLFNPDNGFAGTDRSMLIRQLDDLKKGKGDTVRTKLIYQLRSNRGRAGQEKLRGFEGSYEDATFDVTLNIVRNAVGVESEMVDQRIQEDPFNTSIDLLSDWFAERFALVANLHATGFSVVTDPPYTFHNTINALHADYLLRPNGKAAGNLDSADVFDLNFLNELQLRLKMLRPRIRPAKTPLGDRFLVSLSPEMVKSLRDDDSEWFALMRSAIQGGMFKDNPFLMNALGEFKPFIFYEDDLLPPGINCSNVVVDKTRRGWVGGAQSLLIAFGRGERPPGYGLNRFQWTRERFDYDEEKFIAAKTIVGMGRTRYQHPDEASARETGVVAFEVFADHGTDDPDTVYRDWLDIDGVGLAS